MIILTGVNDKFQVKTAETGLIEIQSNYVDLDLNSRLQTPGTVSYSETITANQDFTFLSSSGTAGTSRALKQLSIYNSKINANIIEIEVKHYSEDDNANITSVVIYSNKIEPGQSIQFTSGQGFYTAPDTLTIDAGTINP